MINLLLHYLLQQLLLKADKTQLIDAYTKGETNNLFNNKANSGVSYTKGEADNLLSSKVDSGVSYTKGEDVALQLLKADKTQLIDSYTNGETDSLLNNKVNQSTIFNKTEIEYLISQIDIGDVDLSGYMTLDTAYTITANKTFNNACRFVSSIVGMSSITSSSFIKSGADDTIVLLEAGGTKPISEFRGESVEDSNYVKKTGQVTQSIEGKLIRSDSSESLDNLQTRQYATKFDIDGAFVKKTGKNLQVIQGYLRKSSELEDVSEDDDDYMTHADIHRNFVDIGYTQQILGTKSFYDNVTANDFIKSG
ncbi:MAG: hypothetical protein EZS28_023858 [Streblomastix strix]|uniref:Uncharacterized protein n=1 Tax=Streblomastix strix TaxID=222440 RepID=A0A5J4VDQ2_9EUKA|nr:MAG: hypothetical protein EZS28_023858 [Streblomastix strix]